MSLSCFSRFPCISQTLADFTLWLSPWLSPNTNLSVPIWSQSRPEISSAELLLKIVTIRYGRETQVLVGAQPYRCLFTARLHPLRLGIIPAAIAAATNIAMFNFCLRLHCLV